MCILVIGGTRFMGPYIISHLCAAGHEVSIFHRGKTGAELPGDVREILGDRDNLPEYASDLQKLSPEVVLDMVIWYERHAYDLMATFAGVARRVVVASSQDVYRAFGRVNRHEDGEIDPCPMTDTNLRSFVSISTMPCRSGLLASPPVPYCTLERKLV